VTIAALKTSCPASASRFDNAPARIATAGTQSTPPTHREHDADDQADLKWSNSKDLAVDRQGRPSR